MIVGSACPMRGSSRSKPWLTAGLRRTRRWFGTLHGFVSRWRRRAERTNETTLSLMHTCELLIPSLLRTTGLYNLCRYIAAPKSHPSVEYGRQQDTITVTALQRITFV